MALNERRPKELLIHDVICENDGGRYVIFERSTWSPPTSDERSSDNCMSESRARIANAVVGLASAVRDANDLESFNFLRKIDFVTVEADSRKMDCNIALARYACNQSFHPDVQLAWSVMEECIKEEICVQRAAGHTGEGYTKNKELTVYYFPDESSFLDWKGDFNNLHARNIEIQGKPDPRYIEVQGKAKWKLYFPQEFFELMRDDYRYWKNEGG